MSKKVKSVLSGTIIFAFVVYMVIVVNILPDSNGVEDVDAYIGSEEVDTKLSESESIDKYINSYIEDMSLRDKVCQLIITTPSALTNVKQVVAAGETTKSALTNYPIGGLIYDDTNYISDEQFNSMLQGTVEFMKSSGDVVPLMFYEDKQNVIESLAEISKDISYIVVQNVSDSDDVPFCFSEKYIGELKAEFDGLIVTEMFVSYTQLGDDYPTSNAVAAIKAGCDVVQTAYLPGKMIEGLEQAVIDGVISEEQINESVAKVLKIKFEAGIFNQE